jgi:hypothetical protein
MNVVSVEALLEKSAKTATRRRDGEKMRRVFIQGATCHSPSAHASAREDYCKRGQQAAVKALHYAGFAQRRDLLARTPTFTLRVPQYSADQLKRQRLPSNTLA